MKKRTRAAAILTAALTSCGFVACGEETEGAFGGNGKVRVQSVYSTYKVMQSATEFTGSEAAIDVQLAKGETEGAQLIMTANGDVGSYELVESDLVNENGDKFGTENIEVNVQYYVNVTQKTSGNDNTAYPVGWTPDMLLPMDICKKYGENTIKDGNNQGLTVEFTTNSDTPAGTYTGSFTLKADKTTQTIPVTVEVWDVDVSKAYGKTWLGIELGQLWYGELTNSDEMYKAYYDTLLNEYKTCGGIVPGSYDIEHFVKTLDSYWENPNFTTFELPASENWYTDESTLYDYVYLLATASTPERLYLERAVVLPIDEPIIGDDEVDDKVYVRTQQIESVKERVWNDLVNEGFFDKEARGGVDGKFAKALKESLDFEVVTTSSDVSYWGDTIMTYCPPIQFYETSLERNQYAAHAQERGSEQWYYTCMQPQYPYPSHHIDDYLLGSRTMRWMQKAYGLEGYLYWCVNQYAQSTETGHIPVDPYTDPSRFLFGSRMYNGDGYLFYPGAKYGLNAPLGSLRLDALRDGQEDYNLMCVYQDTLNALQSYYGWSETPDVNDVLALSYDNLFNGSVYATDDSLLFEARALLARKAALAVGESKFYYETKAVANGKTQASFYVADTNTSVKFNGQTLSNGQVCGQGVVYTVEFDAAKLDEISVEVSRGGKTQTFTESLGASMTAVEITEKLLAQIKVSEGGSVELVENGIKVVLKSKPSDNLFSSRVDLGKALFGNNLKDVQTLTFDVIYQTACTGVGDHEDHYALESERAFSACITPTNLAKGSQIDRFRIFVGESATVRCGNVYQRASENKGEYFSLQFGNVRNVVGSDRLGYEDTTLIITNIKYSKRG